MGLAGGEGGRGGGAGSAAPHLTPPDPDTGGEATRWRAFTILFAVAACFHILGDAVFADPFGVVLVAAGAVAVVMRPATRGAFAVLAAGILVTVWQEAPLLGNHWLLAGFVAVAGLLASIGPAETMGARALPAVRMCFLGFYAFAAFAKLNSSFFDASVTCAGDYMGAAADAIGLGGLHLAEKDGFRAVAAITAAVVECSVVPLLLRRRTRTFGVLLAVGFHLVVALPRHQQFFDFSALLLAGWSTFLPAEFHRRVGAVVARHLPPARAQAAGVVLVVVTGFLGWASSDRHNPSRDELVGIGWWAWQPLAVLALVAVALHVRRGWEGADVGLRPAVGWRAVVPLLVLVNGLTPYLELKTSAGWNMYANLRTAGGETNHFIVPRTFPLTSPQDDLVEVVATEDPVLATYLDRGFLLPVRTFRAYLQHNRGVAASVLVGGDPVEVVAGEPVPDRLGPPVSDVVERFFVLRAVDAGSPERCQTGFLPAR